MYNVLFSKRAVKALKKIPQNYQIKIKDVISRLSIDPFRIDLEKMHTSDATHRLRVGTYRLFLQVDTSTKEIIVSTIKRRTTQTYRY